MPIFNYGSLPSWLLNPIGNVIELLNTSAQKNNPNSHYNTGERLITGSDVKRTFDDVVDTATGQAAIDKEFENNKALAKYQTELQEELYNKYSSPEALMRQYKEAGLNPNLIYGSASSGQSNVPSYSSPAAAHQLSFMDKVNKALSIISSVQGVRNLIYQTSANREAAEQAAIRTHNQFEQMRQNRIKTALLSESVGWTGGGLQSFFKRSALGRRKGYVTNFDELPLFTQYANAVRSEVLNRAYGAYSDNYWNNGSGFNLDGALIQSLDSDARNYWINQGTKYQAMGRKFDYDWNNDYKTILKGAGVAAPIIQTLLRLLGGK